MRRPIAVVGASASARSMDMKWGSRDELGTRLHAGSMKDSFQRHQNRFWCSRLKDFTPDRFLLHQNRFWYTRILSGTPKPFLVYQIERFHARSISTVEKSDLS
jgi:hypothetical protein